MVGCCPKGGTNSLYLYELVDQSNYDRQNKNSERADSLRIVGKMGLNIRRTEVQRSVTGNRAHIIGLQVGEE